MANVSYRKLASYKSCDIYAFQCEGHKYNGVIHRHDTIYDARSNHLSTLDEAKADIDGYLESDEHPDYVDRRLLAGAKLIGEEHDKQNAKLS